MLAKAGSGGEPLDDQLSLHAQADILEALGQLRIVAPSAKHRV